MIYQPPFYLTGREGNTLGLDRYSLAALGITDATLKLASLEVGELTFTQRAKPGRVIPDDNQWITLLDDSGTVLFKGLAKRTFSYKERLYSFTVSDAYKGLMETPLLDADRAFVLYGAQDLGATVLNILARGISAGLPLRAPDAMPSFYLVPKMAFRSSSIAGGIEDALKWDPSCVTRMDHTTEPSTLRFFTRGSAAETLIDLDSDTHKATDITLTPYPEARALSVSFAYARRDGDDVVLFLVQTAGDDSAEANRKLSLYLSGQERSDMLVTEALTTAQKAVAMAQASVAAVGASIDAAAASAQIPLTWSALKPLDSNLQAAQTAQSNFSMYASTGQSITLYTGVGWPPGSPWTGTNTMNTTSVALRTSGGALATGWYPIQTGSFTPAELTTAGATKETRYIRGDMLAVRLLGENNAGMASIESNGAISHTGWTDGYVANSAAADAAYRKYVKYALNIAVDAINMAPTAVAAAVKAAAASGSSALIERAEFVEAPPDLAANYFARQDWTPYKGSISFTPSANVVPIPGDFISVRGEDVPADWFQMKVPVAETSIDLQTLAAKVTIGPSPRMDFNSLVDRLRIPQEDNYEPG
ncbi:MAG: hypothetical protein MUF86_11405 [Akkermansiaceae bacterium]|nr:hypothetical protein [Akkermansiaceae bacterium]